MEADDQHLLVMKMPTGAVLPHYLVRVRNTLPSQFVAAMTRNSTTAVQSFGSRVTWRLRRRALA